MTQKFADNCRALLAASILSTDLSLTVEAGKADRFPVATTVSWSSVLDWFKCVLIDSSGNREVIKVGTRTLGSGVFGNILRAQDGTTALAFTAGSLAICPITAADVEAALTGTLPALNIAGAMQQGTVQGRFVPVGGIIDWSGTIADIPVGWGLCDGTNGTPNLSDRFVMGAKAGGAPIGTTGGSRDAVVVTHTHGVAITSSGESADHTHSGTTASEAAHTHPLFGGNVGRILLPAIGGGANLAAGTGGSTADVTDSGAGSAHGHTFTTAGASADHTHSVTGNTASTGVAAADANLVPYYVLAKIMCLAA